MTDVDTTRAANDRYVYETVEKIAAQARREALDDVLEAMPKPINPIVDYNHEFTSGCNQVINDVTTTIQRLKEAKNE